MQSSAGPSRTTGKDIRKNKLKSSRQIINTSTSSTSSRDNGYPSRARGPSTERPIVTEKTRAIAIGTANRDVLRSVRPLPGGLEVERFAMARSFEISAMQVAMRTAAAGATTRAFQSLPRHLRRRAASHNPRRVPKRLRSKATSEMDSKDKILQTQKKRIKAKTRLLRKKGMTRTEVYRCRQRSKAWLETHIWHAKRMKMINIWGHRLAKSPTQKSHRPSIRAARNGCIIHDASYTATIELIGSRDELIGVLKGLMGGGGWAGSRYEPGGRMAETTFYRFGAWPRGMIGPVSILWRPLESGSRCIPTESAMSAKDKGKRKRTEEDDLVEAGRTIRSLWLRFHPAMFEDVYSELEVAIKTFYESAAKNRTETGTTEEAGQIVMKDLRGDLLTFELMGPKAGRVLRSIVGLTKANKKMKEEAWNNLGNIQTMASLPSGLVMGFQVHDPRLQFPPRKGRSPWSGSGLGEAMTLQAVQPSSALASCGVWDEDERAKLFKPKYKKAQLDGRRNALGIPGTKLQPTDQDNRIPILVIQRSVQSSDEPSRFPSFHGLTVIVPAGWGMAFWQSLVFSGSLVGGLDERHTLALEAGLPSYPFEVPFSPAGDIALRDKAVEEEARWWRRPPAKRANYEALGTKHPFLPDWKELSTQRGTASSPWLVDQRVLGAAQLQTLLSSANPAALLAKFLVAYRKQAGHVIGAEGLDFADALGSGFVRVTLRPVERGAMHDMAMVYMTPKDQAQKPTEVIGYVLAGNYSVSQGRSRGLACTSLVGYLHCLAQSRIRGSGRILVSVRNRNEEGFREVVMAAL